MPADTGRYVFYISNCSFFIINQQKTLRQYMAYSIINLYWCIHLKAREQIGFNYRTPVFHDKICKRLIISRIPVLAWIDKREMPATKIGRLWNKRESSKRNAGGRSIQLFKNRIYNVPIIVNCFCIYKR